jgi:hypothetical protein
MARLNLTELGLFTQRINQDNFILFAKLLNLQNQDSFRTIVELLADNRINLSMLNDLPAINDQTVAAFLNGYIIHANPQILHTPQTSDFNAATYLEGKADGRNLSVLVDLLRSYNDFESRNYGMNQQKLVPDFRLTLDSANFFAYSSTQEIRDLFAQKIIPIVLIAINTPMLETVFPAPESLIVYHTPWQSIFREWYYTVFGPFLDTLRNDELYRLLLSIDDSMAKSQEHIVEFHELYNFHQYAANIPVLFDRTAFELAALGRGYSPAELDAIEESVRASLLLQTNLSESFSLKLFDIKLLELGKQYAGSSGYTDEMIRDLQTMLTMFDKFKIVVNAILSKLNDVFKIIG